MTSPEWALGMVSILMSLALGDIALSAHRLLRSRRLVGWDSAVVAGVSLVVLTIVRLWYEVWAIRGAGELLSFPFYLCFFIFFMILFLLAAACLPDDADMKLSEFRESNRGYFWNLFALFQVGFILLWLYFSQGRFELGESIAVVGPMLLYLVLARISYRPLDIAGPLLMMIYYIWSYWGDNLDRISA